MKKIQSIKTTMLVALLACCCLFSACGNRSKDNEKAKVKFATKVLRPETLVYNLYIPASLHGMNEVDVYPQVSGIIRKVNFTDGIKVSRGQVLFVIDQTEHRLMVQNARANLAAARAQMETTKLKYETTEKLATKKIVSDYVLSTSANAYHEAQAAVQQAQAQLDIARTNLSYCTITSPITGVIKENGYKIGEMADPKDLLSAQLTEVENRYDGIQALINLYTALGGF